MFNKGRKQCGLTKLLPQENRIWVTAYRTLQILTMQREDHDINWNRKESGWW